MMQDLKSNTLGAKYVVRLGQLFVASKDNEWPTVKVTSHWDKATYFDTREEALNFAEGYEGDVEKIAFVALGYID